VRFSRAGFTLTGTREAQERPEGIASRPMKDPSSRHRVTTFQCLSEFEALDAKMHRGALAGLRGRFEVTRSVHVCMDWHTLRLAPRT
jgi:hypothetical protein